MEWQNIKMGRKTYEDLSFFFHETVLNHHHVIGYHSCFYSCSLPLMASAIIIATHGQNILQWQLSKVILSSMYKSNFEAIN